MPVKKIIPPAAETFSVTIPPERDRERLDKALTGLLAEALPILSRARLQALMAEGQVAQIKSGSARKTTDASRKVNAGEVYQLTVPPPEPALPEAQSIKLNVVFEDKDLLVVDKPAGMVVHPAPGNRDRTLVNALLAYCGKSLSGVGGVARPGIVHRLDKDTSGLIVVAKNDLAHQALTRQFADRSLSRTYQALVWGELTPLAGSIDAPIGRHARDRVKMKVMGRGKPALTHYKVLEVFDASLPPASLVECKLATGRTHQIRVHLAHLKNPVIGDPAYGARRPKSVNAKSELLRLFPRQALHAVELQFEHPRSGKRMKFTSPLPPDMAGILKKLRRKTAK